MSGDFWLSVAEHGFSQVGGYLALSKTRQYSQTSFSLLKAMGTITLADGLGRLILGKFFFTYRDGTYDYGKVSDAEIAAKKFIANFISCSSIWFLAQRLSFITKTNLPFSPIVLAGSFILTISPPITSYLVSIIAKK